ncbi:unnamed protein product [Orchesella dallaii]|uniref:Uncharacterized protein n=1 Tax=Orchesella dallaii TaxID=48710 RepID=A0ABP1QPR1_9HEXA
MAIYPCCCVSSTIGATIIGALNIIGGLLGLIWGRITYTALKQIKKLLKKDSEDESQYRSGTNWYNEELSKKIALLQPRLIYGMVMSLASIVTASILLHGIKNVKTWSKFLGLLSHYMKQHRVLLLTIHFPNYYYLKYYLNLIICT